jgi:hypothetical protein
VAEALERAAITPGLDINRPVVMDSRPHCALPPVAAPGLQAAPLGEAQRGVLAREMSLAEEVVARPSFTDKVRTIDIPADLD